MVSIVQIFRKGTTKIINDQEKQEKKAGRPFSVAPPFQFSILKFFNLDLRSSLLTLGITQASLVLLSLNRSLNL